MDQDEAAALQDARKNNSIELANAPTSEERATPSPAVPSLTVNNMLDDENLSPGTSPVAAGIVPHPLDHHIDDFLMEDDTANENDTLGPFADFPNNRDRKSRHRNDHVSFSSDTGDALGRTVQRSRSVISLRAINDSVDKIVKDIRDKFQQIKTGRRNRLLQDTPHLNQIYYSVFKSSVPLPFKLPAEGCAATGPTTQAQFDAIVDSVVDAIEAGIAPKLISQGSSGSYFMYDASGKIVGVFKPKDEEPYGPLSPKWTKWLHRNLMPCFFGRPCLVPNNGYICESAASLLDRQLLTHIVPFTDIVYLSSSTFYYRFFDRRRFNNGTSLPNKVGSFQLFLHGYEQAHVFLHKHPLPDATRPLPQRYGIDANGEPVFAWTGEVLQQFREELEKLVILDYIMRNTDRGLDNWMINVEWEMVASDEVINGQTQYRKMPRIKIGAIDSGLAFPWKHPDEWRSYPFGWLFLPSSIIGQPFSQRTRDHFLPMLCSQEWWEESTLVFQHLFSQDSEFKGRLWKKQWAVMKGQAFNVVETLKSSQQGPLELVRRTRVMVWDDEMDVPLHVPHVNLTSAMDTPMWRNNSTYRDDESLSSYHDTEGEEEEEQGFPEYVASPPAKLATSSSTTESEANQHTKSTTGDRLAVPKTQRRGRGSSLSLEAKYRALEGSESTGGSGRPHNMFDELLSDAQPEEFSEESAHNNHNNHQHQDRAKRAASVSALGARSHSLVNNVGFSIAEGPQASQRVIVERLQTVTSKPPVFTWC